jgi:hypothetical protein
MPGDRAHVHDAAARGHVRQRRSRAVERAGNVDVEDALPVLIAHLGDAAPADQPTRIVHEDVEVPSERRDAGCHGRIYVGAAGRVELECRCNASKRFDLLDRLVGIVRVGGQRDIRASFSQRKRNTAPYTSGAARDERGLSAEIDAHGFSPFTLRSTSPLCGLWRSRIVYARR